MQHAETGIGAEQGRRCGETRGALGLEEGAVNGGGANGGATSGAGEVAGAGFGGGRRRCGQ